MRGLNRGNSAILRARDVHKLLRAALLNRTQIEMIANEQKKPIVETKTRSAIDCVRISQRLLLLDKCKTRSVSARRRRIRLLIARANDNPDSLNSVAQNLFDNNGERRLGDTVPVDQRL
jgi:hypothetical protein